MKAKFVLALTVFLVILFSLFSKPYFANLSSKHQTKAAVNSQNTENFENINLDKYFQDIGGCAVFYSSKEDKYFTYNQDMIDIQEIPCSTFKIISALSGLENEIIKDENTVLRWDGSKQMLEQWEQDLSLESAFRLSANWYFDRIDEQVGKENLKYILEKIQYGNMNISDKTPLGESTIKISPLEQVEFIKKIFKNELPFKEKNIEILKKIMYIHTENGKLYGKTGTSGTQFLENGNQTAWFVGKYNSYSDEIFFAVRIFGDKDNKNILGGTAQKITQSIIEDMYN